EVMILRIADRAALGVVRQRELERGAGAVGAGLHDRVADLAGDALAGDGIAGLDELRERRVAAIAARVLRVGAHRDVERLRRGARVRRRRPLLVDGAVALGAADRRADRDVRRRRVGHDGEGGRGPRRDAALARGPRDGDGADERYLYRPYGVPSFRRWPVSGLPGASGIASSTAAPAFTVTCPRHSAP